MKGCSFALKKIGILMCISAVSIIILLVLDNFVSKIYVSRYFKLGYVNNVSLVRQSDNEIVLATDNYSTIQVVSEEIPKKYKNLSREDLFYFLERDFEEKNKNYHLINYDEIVLGRQNYSCNQYLYEKDGYQTLFLILIVKGYVIKMNYCASNQYFDFELEEFYRIVNNIEVI